MLKYIFASALFASSAFAACPNGCSGNGICGANDKCSCHQNWQGPDCSLRTCTYALAWADTADGTNQAHYYAECSNKGICDRKTGECKCFEGYEGKGCRRSTCPDGCSGHGTCEYIDELAGDYYDRRSGPGAEYRTKSGTKIGDTTTNAQDVPTITTKTTDQAKYHGFLYNLWDAQKIQGCRCDLGYSGPDCASRVAPKGDDPLTTVKKTHQKQAVQVGTTGTPTTAYSVQQFFLIYHDPYGGVWRTDAIQGTTNADHIAASVEGALRDLPNQVLADVTVEKNTAGQSTCVRTLDGSQHISQEGKSVANGCASTATGATNLYNANTMNFNVLFADKPGQTGVQYLLEVDTAVHGDGSFPVSKGITDSNSVGNVAEVMTTANLGIVSELSECSDRGLDNGAGECECFDGFRGLACEEQEALV